jgi:hypothetical protein
MCLRYQGVSLEKGLGGEIKLLPKTGLGFTGFWLTCGGALLLLIKIVIGFPIPTFGLFGLVFSGSGISIWAFIRGDRSQLQYLVVLPTLVLALIWTIAEVVWPH